MTKPREILIFFFILFQSLIYTYLYYSVSASIHLSSFLLLSALIYIYLHISISSNHLSFLISLITFQIYYIWFQILLDSYLLSLFLSLYLILFCTFIHSGDWSIFSQKISGRKYEN